MQATRTASENRWVRLLVAGLLITVGIIAMCASMIMNWRFGWGLASDPMDRTLMAVIHTLVDPGAACLIAAGGLMFAWRWRWMGWLAFICAAILVAYSMVSVFGFMSERIGQLEGHKAAIAVQAGSLKWLQGQRVNMELPRSERRLMRDDVRAATERLAASVRLIPDRHALALAGAIGASVEAVQRALVMVSSGVAQGIKFACLSFGFFLLGLSVQAAEPAGKTRSGSGGSPGSGGEPRFKPKQVHPEPGVEPGRAAVRTMVAQLEPACKARSARHVFSTDAPKGKLSFEQFIHELRQDMAYGDLATPTRQFARQTGWSQTSVVRHAKKLKQRRQQFGRSYGNGEGMRSLAVG
jgi:hypothetical protein